MKVFISHSSKNKKLARRLAKALKNHNIDVWFDEWEILVGHNIVDKVYDGIRHSDFLAIILTKESIASRPGRCAS